MLIRNQVVKSTNKQHTEQIRNKQGTNMREFFIQILLL